MCAYWKEASPASRAKSPSPEASMKKSARMAWRPSLFSTTMPVSLSPSRMGAQYRVWKNSSMPCSPASLSSSIFSSSVFSSYRASRLGSSETATAPTLFSRSSTSWVSPAMTCFCSSSSVSLCHTFTSPDVATPPRQLSISTTRTRRPSRAARTAANSPVQLPPTTHKSTCPHTFTSRAGSVINFRFSISFLLWGAEG